MKKNKEEFFLQLYHDTYKDLYRYIARLNSDKRVLEDILQETFLEAYKKIDLLLVHDNPKGFMYLTAKNKAMKLLRKRQVLDAREIVINEGQEPVYEDTYGDYYQELACILTEDEITILRQYHQEGYSLDELSQNRNISKPALKMKIQRIYKKIKKSSFVALLFTWL